MNHEKTFSSKEQHRLELNAEDLIDLLARAYRAGVLESVPPNAAVTVHVPGGGDWSHMDIDIENDHPIVVTWTVES